MALALECIGGLELGAAWWSAEGVSGLQWHTVASILSACTSLTSGQINYYLGDGQGIFAFERARHESLRTMGKR